MRKLARLIPAAGVATLAYYIEMVGTTGMTQTDKNICELLTAWHLSDYTGCNVHSIILSLLLFSVFLAVAAYVPEIHGLIRKRHIERQQQVVKNQAEKYMSLLDLISEAAKTGWDVDSYHKTNIWDLMYAIRQAAGDGELTLRGRFDRDGTGLLSHYEIITQIPKAHWEQYEINWFPNEPNWKIGTINKLVQVSMCKKNRYLDIELERSSALAWLHGDAAKWRGWYEEKDRRQQQSYI